MVTAGVTGMIVSIASMVKATREAALGCSSAIQIFSRMNREQTMAQYRSYEWTGLLSGDAGDSI